MSLAQRMPASVQRGGGAARGVAWDPLTSPNVNVIALGISKDPNPKTTLLLFWRGSRSPWAAVKLPATEQARLAVRHEAGFLLELHRLFDADVLATIPKRFTAFEAGLPTGAMVVQAFDGSPMSMDYSRAGHARSPAAVRDDLSRVGRWLRDVQDATTQGYGPVDLGAQLSRARARFPTDPRAERACGALEPHARAFAEFLGPKTVVHGDLWLGNILTDQARITGVVDWECAQTCGEPLRDVARFALTYALYLDRGTRAGRRVRGHALTAGEWGAGIRYLLDGVGWFPDLVRDFVRAAMSRLGVDPSLWRQLLLFGLADVVATADDEGWARQHLLLLDKLRLSP